MHMKLSAYQCDKGLIPYYCIYLVLELLNLKSVCMNIVSMINTLTHCTRHLKIFGQILSW